jgi:hypothetical protein
VEEGAGLTLKLPSSKNQCSNHLLSFHICAIIFAMRVLLTGVVLSAAACPPALADNQSFLNGGWAAGNLGFDLIPQTIPLTIDFRAMELSVEDR